MIDERKLIKEIGALIVAMEGIPELRERVDELENVVKLIGAMAAEQERDKELLIRLLAISTRDPEDINISIAKWETWKECYETVKDWIAEQEEGWT